MIILHNQKALLDLRSDESITIKKGDKGAGIVVLDITDYQYVAKTVTQLNNRETYDIKEEDDTHEVKQQAGKIIRFEKTVPTVF